MESEAVLMLVVIGGMIVVTILLVAIGLPMRMVQRNRREVEQTKREIAAYVAEGSMTPDDGERLIRAASEEVKHARELRAARHGRV